MILAPEKTNWQAEEEHIEKCGYNHDEKGDIILLPDAIVDPTAMMIEMIHTTIAYFTMPGCLLDIAMASVTVKAIVYYWYESWSVSIEICQ